MPKQDLVKIWTKRANDALAGKTIKSARYLSRKEADDLGWSKLVPVIELSDGSLLFPSMDDEGNDGGALFGQTGTGEDLTLPVINLRLL